MSRVTMAHPDLPDQPIEVSEASVPHYQAAGWQVVEDKPNERTAKRRPRTKGSD